MSQGFTRKQFREQSKPKKKPSKFKKFIKITFLLFFIIGLAVGGYVGNIAYGYIKKAPEIDVEQLKDPLSSKVYDRNGDFIIELGVEKRNPVDIEDVPNVVKNAVIATEDARFYSHIGIDFKRIASAIKANFEDGYGSQGASTITQQVIKMSFLTTDKTLERKVQEQWMAIELERQLSKDQILEIYLNKIYYSEGAYGIAVASKTYFGKPIEELELHEAALLAGIPQRPNAFNPFDHPEEAEKRRNTVLYLMHRHGFISTEQMEEAKSIPVSSYVKKQETPPTKYHAFVDMVIEELEASETLKEQEIDIYTSGLKIYTTLDPKSQDFVKEVLDTDKYIKYPNERFQASFAVIDTKTGEIHAVGDGRNRTTLRGYNFAVDIKRQPGSTIKPVLDYGPAVEYLGWSPLEPIKDEPYTYSDGTPIHNWDNRYWGTMTMRKALAHSRNIPALKAMQASGIKKSRDFGRSLGLQLDDTIYEPYSIGGFNGVSPVELAGAYSAFGNNGVFNKPHTVTKIVLPDEREISLKPEPVVAMKDSTAFLITDMLKSVVSEGTGQSAKLEGIPFAAKTGTTNFDKKTMDRFKIPYNGVPDIWFAGYSTDYSIAVWTGYSETNATDFIKTTHEKAIAKDIFKVVMTELSKDREVKDFEMPKSVEKVGVERGTYPFVLASEYTPKSQIIYEYFAKSNAPKEESTKYIRITSPSGLSAKYEEDKDEITLKWKYPQEDLADITFEIRQSVNEGKWELLDTTKDLSFATSTPKPGYTYKFQVIAISAKYKGKESSPSEVSYEHPDPDAEVVEEPKENTDKPKEQDSGDSPSTEKPKETKPTTPTIPEPSTGDTGTTTPPANPEPSPTPSDGGTGATTPTNPTTP